MTKEVVGANRALAASPSSRQGVSPLSGFDHGYGAWVEALCAFYERDCLPQKAANLRAGAPLDYLDRRAIEALKAAFGKVAA